MFFAADISGFKFFALFITYVVVFLNISFSSLQIASDVVDAVRKTFVVVVKHSTEGKLALSIKNSLSLNR